MYRETVSPHAADGLRELRAVHGVQPSDEDVVRLNELGWRVDGDKEAPSAPYRVGNVTLFQPTGLAIAWYAEHAAAFGASRDLRIFAYAFALAHGRGLPVPERVLSWQERLVRRLLGVRDTVTLDQLQGPDAARRAVRAWMLTCRATVDEIDEAVGFMDADAAAPAADRARAALRELLAFFGEDRETVEDLLDISARLPVRKEPEGETWEAFCHEIAAATGVEPGVWMRAPQTAAITAYRTALRFAAAGTGGSIQDLDLVEAVKAFRAGIVEVIKREKAKCADETK